MMLIAVAAVVVAWSFFTVLSQRASGSWWWPWQVLPLPIAAVLFETSPCRDGDPVLLWGTAAGGLVLAVLVTTGRLVRPQNSGGGSAQEGHRAVLPVILLLITSFLTSVTMNVACQ